jgi:ABC-type multidrug transport system fused ATPase/permease subunit
MAAVGILTIIVSVLDGIGLALIVPLVELLVGLESSASAVPIIRWVESAFEWFGFELSIGMLVAVILALQVVRVIGLALQMWLTTLLGARFERTLRVEAYDALIKTSWLHFTAQKSGELVNVLIPQSQRAGGTIRAYSTALASLFTIGIYFTGAILISWDLSLIAAGYTLLVVIALSYFLVISRRRGIRIAAELGKMSVESSESFGGMKAIKAAGLEQHASRRFISISNRLTRELSLNGLNQGSMHATAESFFLIAMILGLLFATHTLGLPAGALLLFAMLFLRLFQRAKVFQTSLMEFYQTTPALSIITDARKIAASNVERQGGKPFEGIDRGMELSGISFTYPERSRGLDDVSISIPSGTSVAIVGPSGGGKTTIIDLIVGLIEPDHGNITVGKHLLSGVSLSSWREKIAYVTQGTTLFNDSVVNNIAFGHETADTELLAHVSAQSGVDRFISELPAGYDTVIGERGVRLSGGQRQRIALARALYRQPQLLILDEATSELDTHSERRFQETIDQLHGNLTILMVAHRLSTVMNVDNIYLLDGGTIVESGSPSELIESRGMFHAMLNEAPRASESKSTDESPDARSNQP